MLSMSQTPEICPASVCCPMPQLHLKGWTVFPSQPGITGICMGEVLMQLLWEEWVTEHVCLDEYINHKANLQKAHFTFWLCFTRVIPAQTFERTSFRPLPSGKDASWWVLYRWYQQLICAKRWELKSILQCECCLVSCCPPFFFCFSSALWRSPSFLRKYIETTVCQPGNSNFSWNSHCPKV